jgi:hypothetical protein
MLSADFTEGVRLYHPTYIFDVENNIIKNIRKRLHMNFEDAASFWDKHKCYNFIKPVNRNLLIPWMKAIYFKHNFSLAYSRNTRSQITLRLSTFTSKSCMLLTKDTNRTTDPISIKNFLRKFYTHELPSQATKEYNNINVTIQDVEKATMNNDATASMIYSFFEYSRIIETGEHTMSTVASLSPQKISWLTINNDAGSLLQYIFNFDDFKLDLRKNLGIASLEADKKIIEKYYVCELN